MIDDVHLPRVDLPRGLAVAALVGVVLGVATQVGQSLLPAGVGQLANSISPWLTVAFAVGALQFRPRDAAAAGFVTLVLALVGYYGMVFVHLLGSVWVADAAYLAVALSMVEVALGYALVGLAIPLLLGRTLRGRMVAWAAMVPTVALGGLGFLVFITLQEVLNG